MEKKLDLSKSVYDLVQEYPEVIDIMKGLGFTEITNKVMLHSVGKIMTIPKGAKMKGISMMDIVGAFMKAGFTLEGDMPNLHGDDVASAKDVPVEAPATQDEEPKASENTEANAEDTVPDSERVEQLKGFLKRLGTGEALGDVRKDFASQFKHVEASEIMKAEQGLMREGTPLEEVQQLCDLHSALFHGSTIHEQMEEEHAKVEAALEAQDKKQTVTTLVETIGHPLNQMTEENKALNDLIEELRPKVADKTATVDDVNRVRQLSVHYAKKGDLLYPKLKVDYAIGGPSMVMWTVDGDIRDQLGDLAKSSQSVDDWYRRFDELLTRAQEMILEVTFVDHEDINRYFNDGEKVFKRPTTAIGRDVFSCHPPKVEPIVRGIIDSFRKGDRDNVAVWLEKQGRPFYVNYMAVRDKNKKYLGTLELVQDMQFAKDHFARSK